MNTEKVEVKGDELIDLMCCDCRNMFKMNIEYYIGRKRGKYDQIRCKKCLKLKLN